MLVRLISTVSSQVPLQAHPWSNMTTASSSPVDLRVQTIENCKFFSPPRASISLVVAREALGTFKAIVVRTDNGEREAVLSETGSSMQDALQALQVKSAEAVQNYIATNGFALVPSVKHRRRKHKGGRSDGDDSDSDSDTASSTLTLEECESLSDDETISITSVGRAKTRSRRKAKTRHGRPRTRSSAATSSLRARSRSVVTTSSDSEPHYDPPIMPSRRPPVFSHLPTRPLHGCPSVWTPGVVPPRHSQLPRPGAVGQVRPINHGTAGLSMPAATTSPASAPALPPRAATVPAVSPATATLTSPSVSPTPKSSTFTPPTTATTTATSTPTIINIPSTTTTPTTTSPPFTTTNPTITPKPPTTSTQDIILHIRSRQHPHLAPNERRAIERVPLPLTLRGVKQAALASARRAQQQLPHQQLHGQQMRPGGGGGCAVSGPSGHLGGFWAQQQQQLRPVSAVVKAVVVEGVSYDLSGLGGGDGGDGNGAGGGGGAGEGGDLSGLMQVLRRPGPGRWGIMVGGMPPPPRFEVEVWYGRGEATPVVVAVDGGRGGGGGGEGEEVAGGGAGQGTMFSGFAAPPPVRGVVGQPQF